MTGKQLKIGFTNLKMATKRSQDTTPKKPLLLVCELSIGNKVMHRKDMLSSLNFGDNFSLSVSSGYIYYYALT